MNYFKVLLATSLGFFSTKHEIQTPVKRDDPPPATWKEHWFDHVQLVKLQHYDNSIALYYDDDMDKTITWPRKTLKEVWDYTRKNYGSFGKDPRLFVILHAGKYGGGHPSTYFDESHDYRNTIDVGQNNSWAASTNWNLDATVHEIGHIVESASNNTHESPAFPIWKDSKWIEIYQYDVYKKLNWKQEEERWFNTMMKNKNDFPRKNTQWFKNWFYPIYSKYGETKVLVKFFSLLSKNFPTRKVGNGSFEYTRNMNFGEFIHFWSGAAGVDLKDLALTAFGSNDEVGQEWMPQLEKARKEFNHIKY